MMKKVLMTLILVSGLSAWATGPVVTTEASTPAATAEVATASTEAAVPAASTPMSAAEAAKLSEDQIPLSIDAAKKTVESGSSATKALMSMMIVLILIASTYYFVRRYKFSNTVHKPNTRIQVISQHYLGPKKSLAIIHVAGESMLVGITDQNISMIKSLSLIDDEVPADLPNNFGQTMAQVEGGAVAPKAAAVSARASAAAQANKAFELDEEFSFANVTDTVSKKIKSMRSIS